MDFATDTTEEHGQEERFEGFHAGFDNLSSNPRSIESSSWAVKDRFQKVTNICAEKVDSTVGVSMRDLGAFIREKIGPVARDYRDFRSFNTSSNNASSTLASITSHMPERHPQSADPFLDPGIYSTAHRVSALGLAFLSSIAMKESVRGNRRWPTRGIGTAAWFLALGVIGYLTCFVPHKDIELGEEMKRELRGAEAMI